MSSTPTLTSMDNPRVKTVVRLRRQRERRQTGLLVAEGVREVQRALDAGLVLQQLFWCEQILPDGVFRPEVVLGANRGAEGCRVTDSLIMKMAYREQPEGLLGVFEQPNWSLERLAAEEAGPNRPAGLWLIAVGGHKPGNLGAMVRTAAAAGCRAVMVTDAVIDPFNPNVIRSSTAAVFEFPVVVAGGDEVLAFFHDRAVRLVTALPGAPSLYSGVDLTGPTGVVIGPEDTGLVGRWAGVPATPIGVPMTDGTVDSLNASAAAAVILYEAVRQRAARG